MNDFFAATNSAGFVGKPMIGVPEQMDGYPKGISNTSPFTNAPLTLLHSLIAAGDGTEALMEIYSGEGFFFGQPFLSGTGGPGQFQFSPAAQPTADLFYVQVTTLTNDFSITSATAPWLFGVQNGYTGAVVAGPAWTVASTWTITAAGDGVTGTMTILRTTSVDGPFIVREQI